MNSEDIARVKFLFDIINHCVSHTGKFASIQSAAFDELTEINAGLRQQQLDRKAQADTDTQEQARAQAAIDAQHQEKPEEDGAVDDDDEGADDANVGNQSTIIDPVRRT